MIKGVAVDFLQKLNAFAPARFLNRNKLLILMYHRFSSGEEIGKTSAALFERHLVYLKLHYNPISLSEAVTRYIANEPVPPRSVVLTVDDGYADFFDVAFPLLTKYEFPATIYVVTDFVGQKAWIWTDKMRFVFLAAPKGPVEVSVGTDRFEFDLEGKTSRFAAAGKVNSTLKRLPDDVKEAQISEIADSLKVQLPESPPAEFGPLTFDQLEELSKSRIEIGSHTVSHPILTNVDEQRLKDELEKSRSVVEPLASNGMVHFCYPNGNVSDRERDAAKAADFASAVTTEIRLCNNEDDLFRLPRIDAEPEMGRFVQATSGFDRLKPNVR
ncbi:MAG: polysaccharide deacetylase family protein [Pyrinomonadaceae bacterium]